MQQIVREPSYGSENSFTTLKVPTLTTQAVSDIDQTTATGNGNLTDLGIPNPTAHGICWSTSTNPTKDDFVNNLALLHLRVLLVPGSQA
jgi:hypothetical protein